MIFRIAEQKMKLFTCLVHEVNDENGKHMERVIERCGSHQIYSLQIKVMKATL